MTHWTTETDTRGLLLRLQTRQLSAGSAREVFAEVRETVGSARTLVMDMRQLDFMDSSAIGELVLLSRRLNAEGIAFRIAGLGPQLTTLVKMMRLEQVMGFSPDVDTAFGALGSTDAGAA